MSTYTDTTGLLYTLDGSNATIAGLGTYNLGPNGVLTIPGQVGGSYTVVAIGADAFIENLTLASIDLSNTSITIIGNTAFGGCTNLASVSLPNTLTEISPFAFTQCIFSSIAFPNSLTTIGESAFATCANLASINLSNTSMTTLGAAFSGCTNLSSVSLPTNLTAIGAVTDSGSGAFQGCTKLTNLNFLPNNISVLGNYAFAFCTGLINITLPNPLTTIGTAAFRGCTNLTNVSLPNSLVALYRQAFRSCTSLNVVTFAGVINNFTTTMPGFHPEAFYLAKSSCILNTSTDVTLWPTYSSGAGGATGFDESSSPGGIVRTVVQGTPLAPTASAQTFTSPADVGDLTATRVSVNAYLKWYSTSSGGSNLPPRTALASGTYYVSQSLSTLESTRTSVSVTVQAAEVACFAEGTRVLTQNGYKAIEALKFTDLLLTADQRIIDFKLLKTTLGTTTERTAPYLIQPHAFGHNAPSAPIRLSANHKIQMRKGLWTSPATAALTNPLVKQCAVGGPVTYYHIECENYLQDNIVTEGLVVESFATLKTTGGRTDIYTWNSRKNAYTRLANVESGKSSKAPL